MVQLVKNLPTNTGDARDMGSIPGLGWSPGGGHGNRLQYSCLENPPGRRGLVGCHLWGRTESETTEETEQQQQQQTYLYSQSTFTFVNYPCLSHSRVICSAHLECVR